ncbi:deoxynucleoside kinase [Eisenibacter elegans]|uniref:deoxynucleoside kinase n=1 Tax=Eisenibacter elegans TaxID=997 RepID=UPI000687474A|nr:deoxynucleoside kinase [Eisenibacter elegans]
MDSLICVDGVVGAGKTTLGEILCRQLNFSFFKEPVDDNPLLAKFYHDQERYSFPMQVYFLNKRFRMLKEAAALPNSCLMDRSIYGDVIFARLLMLQGKMSQEEFELYEELLFNMLEHVARPKLMVYLQIDVDNAIKRIQERGRDFEQAVPRQYWELLNQEYEHYFKNYDFSELLVIDVNDADFREEGAVQERIIRTIADKLHLEV